LVHWIYSSRCNLKCKFCFGFNEEAGSSIDEIILGKLKEAPVKFILFSGGEPLIRKNELFKTAAKAKNNGFVLALDTNGLLIKPDDIGTINELFFRIGLPLYAGNPALHDEMTGYKNHFNTIVKILQLLQKKKIKIRINTMVSKQNYNDLESLGSILEKFRIDYWNLYQFHPVNKAEHFEKIYDIPNHLFNEMAERLKSKFPTLNIVSVEKGSNDRAYIFIKQDGAVFTVRDFKQVKIGDLKEESMNDILKNENVNLKRNLEKSIKERYLVGEQN
jgi:MoaA/NifB/PqqE/SkfB family radical SAM enzyme